MSQLEIRRLHNRDHDGWRTLWRGYNEFYDRTVEDRTTDRVWQSLCNGDGQPFGFVAAQDGELVGFTHYFFLPSTSDWGPRCYMQDLFADPCVRGRGVGHKLIEAVYAQADEHGAAQTYWLTATSNKTAQKLYDRVATMTPFVKYRR